MTESPNRDDDAVERTYAPWPIYACFIIACVLFVISLVTPSLSIPMFVGRPNGELRGFVLFIYVAPFLVSGILEGSSSARDVTSHALGVHANLIILASILFGRILRRHARWFCYGSLSGCLAAALITFVKDGLLIGYWLWVASLGFLTLGWWLVWRRAIRLETPSIERHSSSREE